MVTFILVTDTSKEVSKVILDQIFYPHYLMQFCKDKKTIWALINSDSEVNTIILTYAAKLGLKVCSTNVGAYKIDGSLFKTFGMVIADFQIINKLSRARFL